MKIGLIGGSGLYDIEGMTVTEDIEVTTPYGSPSSVYKIGTIGDKTVIFLPRHGSSHNIPPHKINYRANIFGFKQLGVERIISVSAVGGINSAMPPGSVVILDQIIDMTGGARIATFYDEGRVVHIDFTEPYCPEMRAALVKASENSGIPVINCGTYVCVNGPRLETAKEIEFFSTMGADVVGMTAMPESSLAREMEICMSGLAVVTNSAAGISANKLTVTEVIDTMKRSITSIKSLIKGALTLFPVERGCPCKDALRDSGV